MDYKEIEKDVEYMVKIEERKMISIREKSDSFFNGYYACSEDILKLLREKSRLETKLQEQNNE